MTTNISRLGPNSLAISYTPSSSVSELLTAFDTALAAQGWELFDAAAGTNTHCYRAPIADGTMAYKYFVLDLSAAPYITCKVYESWNAAAHTGANPALGSEASANSQRYSLTTGGTVFVFATARYALFLSRLADGTYGSPTGSTFCGIVEFSRDNPNEVPGASPIFAWIHGSYMLGAGHTASTLRYLSMPKTRTNQTGQAAIDYQAISTIYGRPTIDNSTNYFTQLYKMIPNQGNVFDTNNTLVITPCAFDQIGAALPQTGAHLRGRLYGIKFLSKGIGAAMDRLDIKVDTNLFYDPNAVEAAPHIVLSEMSYGGRFAVPL
jgi:hypothetical protein